MLICTKMRKVIEENISIPSDLECSYNDKIFICRKDSNELSRKIDITGISLSIHDNSIILKSLKGNKIELNKIKSVIAHIKNMFNGLSEKFVYKLEACNVHFPMTLKAEKDKLVIGNFLGEKNPRLAKILPNVDVDIKGNFIVISSYDKESAGQTAANFEKITKIRGRDRRIFQDGIYITDKPERK